MFPSQLVSLTDDENAFLGLQWNNIINQPHVSNLFGFDAYIVIEFEFIQS